MRDVRRMRLRLGSWRWLLWALFLAGGIAFAGLSPEASGSRDDVPYTGVRVHVSAAAVVDVRTLARRPARPEPASPPEPRERAEPPPKALPELPPSMPTRTSAVPSPYVSASFLAQTDTPLAGKKTESPPDTNGAVGREKLMSTLNSNYVIQRKSDGKVLSRVSMTSFWSRLGTHHPFDPRVLYDPYSDRWLVSAANDPLLASSSILYGISDTSDPQGSWHLYAIDADPTNATWADFPTLGFDQSTVAIDVNMFAAGTGTYVSSRLIVLDYAALRAGTSGQPVDISVPGGFALQPAVTYSPTEETLYLVEHLDSIVRGLPLLVAARHDAHGRWRSAEDEPARALGHAWAWKLPAPVGRPRSRRRRFTRRQRRLPERPRLVRADDQPAAEQRRGLRAAHRRPVGRARHERRVRAGRPDRGPGRLTLERRPLVRVRIDSRERAGRRTRRLLRVPVDDFVDAAYAYRAGTDPPNTMREPVTLKDGEGPYTKTRGGLNRWGDYSGAQVDPSDDLSLWTVQEYARIPTGRGDGSGRWGTWWGRVGGGQPLPTPQCKVPSVVGVALAKAWRQVASAHCRLWKVRRVKSRGKRGRVLRQSPGAGQIRRSDARVSLTVGR